MVAWGTREALRILASEGHLSAADASLLTESLNFLFSLESATRLSTETSSNKISRDPAENLLPARLMGFQDGRALLDEYVRATSAVRAVFDIQYGPDPP